MAYIDNIDEELTLITIGKHTIDRMWERFAPLAKELGFEKDYFDENVTHRRYLTKEQNENMNYNNFLLFELFKRSKEVKTIYNDPMFIMQTCVKHDIGYNDFKMFINGNIVFLCEQNRQEQDKIIIRTVIPSNYHVHKYITKSDTVLNYNDKSATDHYRLKSLTKEGYYDQVRRLYKNEEHPLFCERLERIRDKLPKKVLLPQQPTIEEQIIDNHPLSDVPELDFVMTNEWSDLLVILREERGRHKPANVLYRLPYTYYQDYLKHKDKQAMISQLTEPLETDYFKLLAINFDSELKFNNEINQILKNSLPEEFKQKYGINNKMLQLGRLDHLFLKNDRVMNAYLGIEKHNIGKMRIIQNFAEKYFLYRDFMDNFVVTGLNGNIDGALDKLDMLSAAVDYFDKFKLSEEDKQKLFDYLNGEIRKYKFFDKKLSNAIQTISNKQIIPAMAKNDNEIEVKTKNHNGFLTRKIM